MNKWLNERIKHRLVGVLVIMSLGIIFLPPMMKQSNQRLEDIARVVVRIPPKPEPPQMDIPKAKAMLQSIAAAEVTIAPVVLPPEAKNAVKAKPIGQVSFVQKIPSANRYVVQLASFSQVENATVLIKQLRTKGYEASYTKVSSKQGDVYKVIVGHPHALEDAYQLQKSLASLMKLKGFVVKVTNVS